MPGRMAARVFSCISATTRPARRILASSSLVLTMPGSSLVGVGPAGEPPTLPPVVDGVDEAGAHHVGVAEPVDRHQLVALQIPGDERGRLLLVKVQAPADGILRIVLPLDDL